MYIQILIVMLNRVDLGGENIKVFHCGQQASEANWETTLLLWVNSKTGISLLKRPSKIGLILRSKIQDFGKKPHLGTLPNISYGRALCLLQRVWSLIRISFLPLFLPLLLQLMLQLDLKNHKQ